MSIYKKDWKQVDSFLNIRKPLSAKTKVVEILKKAQSNHQSDEVLKAQYWKIALEPFQENADENIIKTLENISNTVNQPAEKAFWQNRTANAYWNYFSRYQYDIFNRTNLEENKSEDIATWDAKQFHKKISSLYLASISNKDNLKNIPLDQYKTIVNLGENTQKLRPSLYDFLVWDAIDYFINDNIEITKPIYKFELDDVKYFSNAAQFAHLDLQSKDSSSLKLQALKLYQDLLAHNLSTHNIEGLIDADCSRLKFVYNNAVLSNKTELYQNALNALAQQYKSNQSVAQALFLAVKLKLESNGRFLGYDDYLFGNTVKSSTDLVAINKEFLKIISDYPKSEGAINAHNAILELNRTSLAVTLEDAYPPQEPSKFLLKYENSNQIDISIFKTDILQIKNHNENGKLIKNWQQNIPIAQDLQQHSVEIKIDPLDAGLYWLVVKDIKQNVQTKTLLQISNLAAILQSGTQVNNNNLMVVNRTTGFPIKNPQLLLLNYIYQNASGIYKGEISGNINGDHNGNIPLSKISNKNNYPTYALVNGTDTLALTENYYIFGARNSYSNNNKEQTTYKSFLFTDRSIYRPGQMIYYKGILLESQGNKKHHTVAQQTVNIQFSDANGQLIKSVKALSNEYGSFSGSFIAPETGLMGQMSIQVTYKDNSVNYTTINVEEYKRPKFFVNFDTLKENYKLYENIVIKGDAKAYAGNNIDNAEVKYRVVRKVRFPYFWSWRRPIIQEEMEIKNGIIQTNENGKFEFSFEAAPDKSIDPKSLPVFTFEIHIDITDLNGETRSNTNYISVGYQSMLLNVTTPKEVLASNFKSIQINTTNLNGTFTPASVQLSIHSLESPDRFYRERKWETPSDFVMSEKEFNKYFPLDMYKEEWKPENRKEIGVIHQANFTSIKSGNYELKPEWFKQSGYYLITVTSKDKEGKEVKDKQNVFVYIPNQIQYDIPLFISTDKSIYHPDENIKLFVQPAHTKINLLQYNSWNKDLNFKKSPLTLPVTEEDRGSLSTFWFYILNNRTYQAAHSVNIPWDNKDLSIEWATHRDKVEPGTKEEWMLTIRGNKKEKVAAELVAGLYDASLDALKPHAWNWSKMYNNDYFFINWTNYGFTNRSNSASQDLSYQEEIEKQYPYWNLPPLQNNYDDRRVFKSARMVGSKGAAGDLVYDAMPAPTLSSRQNADTFEESIGAGGAVNFTPPSINEDQQIPSSEPQNNSVSLRTNFEETAFFMPQLQTDADGNIILKFSLPDALTEWKFMTFAHTPDWQTGYLSGSIKTQKSLMVTPNLPRFFRQGDQITLATKISNLSETKLNGTAQIEILDAATLQPLNLPFGFKENSQSFTVAANQSTVVNFTLNIPTARFEPVIVRIVAKTDKFSDGEEHIIPVLTNRMLVTESLPLPVYGNNTEIFTFDKLLKSAESKTLLNQSLTVEFTGNPAWYAVQALPYLMEFPHECSEQIFSRFYANALAAHIVAQSPKVATIFNQWRTVDTAALLSNLEKNQELKTALLEETPWVLEAKNETQRKKNIARLFETHQLAKGVDKALQKLSKLQNNDGSFSWFPGMKGDRYITQYILTGIVKLQSLNVSASKGKEIENIQEKGLAYLDQEILKDYRAIKKDYLDKNNLSNIQIQYLYMRSFLNAPISKELKIAHEYYTGQQKRFWNVQNNFMQGMIALTQYRKADKKLANTIMESLSERAFRNKEMGMYWKNDLGYLWYDLPIETHSLLISAFEEIVKDEKIVDDLKVWLLKQKQTQDWKTTTATADACYALLKSGTDWLQYEPQVSIQLGKETVSTLTEKTEAGTGYFKKRIDGAAIKSEMGNIKVTIDNKNNKNTGTAWGAVYWQYFEDMDKITTASNENPLHISKQLFIETSTNRGLVLKEITENFPLKVGDKVKVRIVLKTDRAMDYLHLKDMRAAGFEPINVLSNYKWSNNFGYYESTKDLATHFFIDHLPKGTFVFEYPLVVAQKGKFSNGISTLQCMYAPEFNTHTEGIIVKVK